MIGLYVQIEIGLFEKHFNKTRSEIMTQVPYQYGLQRINTGGLQSLWLETPGYCNLACPYCFACGGEPLRTEELLTFEDIEKILVEAKKMGMDVFGIPGAGEPLLSINRELTMRIIRKCAELQVFVVLFTTGEFITPDLAAELYALPVEILLKCNSFDPELQDAFVSDASRGRIIHGFGEKRNRTLELLMQTGFNDGTACMKDFGRKSRLALVTSIMTDEQCLSNLDEVVSIFRFCREHNIIFDCDSVLKRGRGASCNLHTQDELYRDKLLELQRIDREEYGNDWSITQSYAGGPACDRYAHHLYITQYGEIFPCIGATGVKLGNICDVSLQHAWESREMQIIHARQYGGKCGKECANFAEGKCNSCLGRRTVNLTNEFLLTNGYVETIGCWNFRKK